ncbi:LysE family translocator [Vibrio sp. Of7-15]|uniref:LysE family translocator n=1 Tax=Vibrio sp. Of7-15 TaxID=2724879 RepID=UPI001EF36EBF|nr:LysE family translocator [Vibrio sp. Of7-15]MCG7498049.1 LysE family translocator [Vibrio sp. Of7-15]
MEVMSLALVGLLIVMSPGADFVLILKNSINDGRNAGLWTAAGISLAIGVHVSYSMLGISYLISQNEALFSLVRYLGAGYLIYIGLKGVLTANNTLETVEEEAETIRPVQYVMQGFLCNLLNPKTMLFFLSLFSQLIGPEQGSGAFALWYGLYIAVLHGLWFGAVAMAFTSSLFKAYLLKMKKRLNQACGIGLIGFGSYLAIKS